MAAPPSRSAAPYAICHTEWRFGDDARSRNVLRLYGCAQKPGLIEQHVGKFGV